MASFFDQVYLVVQQIPRGKVASYGQVAAILGSPRAARTVGWALASLRESNEDDVPWQRVINSQGRVSIRSMRHGVEEQQRLLEEEGVEFDARGYVDWRRFGWDGLSPVELEALLESEQ
ncbi:MAG: methylated-DNA--[protein]-cysteine S-methyltransferase [Anaerolineae bacterium]|nr:methylated-DNA--[protein]-cysteine S-methyltransferase [Anaerolineae bacterium]MCB9143049.1 methylated-DNA--[protein]-cysteine S-methyltransferase [Anaerolineales bacterium]MCO5246239.1 methylated-DNA--[protein]-cysteine S-methyltransferase [Anaerolineae bacterium]